MFSLFKKPFPVKHHTLIIVVSIFLALIANWAFFTHVVEVYTLSWRTLPFVVSLWVVLASATTIVLALLSWRGIAKPLLITVLILSSLVAYFMDTYDVVIDSHMIENAVQTNLNESVDLFSLTLIGYLLAIGVVPSVLVYRADIAYGTLRACVIEKSKVVGTALLVAAAVMALFSKNYTSFFREHKPLRYYANPAYCLYSAGHYLHKSLSHPYTGLQPIGMDAKRSPKDPRRELVILVVGEAARWDHFSLNGYGRETNPLLKKEEIINFSQFSSCGTETAVSVPCMFSSLTRSGYDGDKALHTENVLDVLRHAGTHVLWRDNNSDSKGVALRAEYQDFKLPQNNPVCDNGECRDEGMLEGLQEYIDAHPSGDIVIVLHQMGNHGPAYYKRYPKAFEKFTPVCRTNQLEQCSKEEITNAYDNAILYTDYFLAKTIALLKRNDSEFETAMFYVSDHGESLGEKGLYLHGFPYAIAPEGQKHVAAMMWFGKHFQVNQKDLKAKEEQPITQDSYFHTVLNLAQVNTKMYKPELDILHGIH